MFVLQFLLGNNKCRGKHIIMFNNKHTHQYKLIHKLLIRFANINCSGFTVLSGFTLCIMPNRSGTDVKKLQIV